MREFDTRMIQMTKKEREVPFRLMAQDATGERIGDMGATRSRRRVLRG